MRLPDGIYLNLPMELYLADDALGASDEKGLLASAVQWFAKNRNKVWQALVTAHMTPKERERAELETFASIYGTALHTAVLEPDAFDDRYLIEPERPDWPSTIAEMEAAIRHAGGQPPRSSARRAEFLAVCRMNRIKTDDDWGDELDLISAGRIRLSARLVASLKMTATALERHSVAPNLVRGGLSEVTVIYTTPEGLRLKCRFDHLRVKTCADIKSYRLREGFGAVESFLKARDDFWYSFSAAHYMDMRTVALPALVESARMFEYLPPEKEGDDPFYPAAVKDLEYLHKVAAYDKPEWWWICASTGGYPEIDAVNLPTDLLAFKSYEAQVQIARANYMAKRQQFGEGDDEAWTEDRGGIILNESNFSNFHLNKGGITYDTL